MSGHSVTLKFSINTPADKGVILLVSVNSDLSAAGLESIVSFEQTELYKLIEEANHKMDVGFKGSQYAAYIWLLVEQFVNKSGMYCSMVQLTSGPAVYTTYYEPKPEIDEVPDAR